MRSNIATHDALDHARASTQLDTPQVNLDNLRIPRDAAQPSGVRFPATPTGRLGRLFSFIGIPSAVYVAFLAAGCAPTPAIDTATPEVLSFKIDPTCNESAKLDVALGEWFPPAAFTALTAEEPPQQIFGPQGGQHFLVALDVGNPALDHPGFRMVFGAWQCADACEDDANWHQVGAAKVDSLPGQHGQALQQDDSLLLGSFFLVLETWADDQDARITATILDACARFTEVTWNGRTGGEPVGP